MFSPNCVLYLSHRDEKCIRAMYKNKELVTLREKQLTTGSKSLFLDYTVDGIRHKDYLKLYIIPERTKLDKRINDETMRVAQAAKSQKILDLQNKRHRLRDTKKQGMQLLDYLAFLSEDYRKRGKPVYCQMIQRVMRQVKMYGQPVTLHGIDKPWLNGFISFMRGNGISETTVHIYFSNLNTALNNAYRDDIIDENPISRMRNDEKPSKQEFIREYLTIEELKTLMQTECENETVKQAFLFGCFSGLRLSDIENLTWGKIRPSSGGGWRVEATQIKTKQPVMVPLSENAISVLPARCDSESLVWPHLPYRKQIGLIMRRWVEDAGITKHITFHCSRHTNATLLLTYGADLYTVMSLLGQKKITTTQIYAHIINEKKEQAVNLIPKI